MSRFSSVFFASILALAAHGAEPPTVTAGDILDGRYDWKDATLIGEVRDVLSDETNPKYVFFVVDADGETVYAALQTDEDRALVASRYIGARVRLSGVILLPWKNRRIMGRELSLTNEAQIAVLSPASGNPFDVPELPTEFRRGPTALASLGRRRTDGFVLAIRDHSQILLSDRSNTVFNAELVDGPLPACGDFITLVGFPVTDMHRINFVRGRWRAAEPWPVVNAPPSNITAASILTDANGRPAIQQDFHGRFVRLVGILRGLSRPGTGEDRLYLDCDSTPVSVAATDMGDELDAIPIGSRIEVTGICVLPLANWQPNMAFPRHRTFEIVLRSPADVRLLTRPAWWTVGRLMVVITLLVAALLGILVWNRTLRRLAERRGAELLREQLAGIRSKLKVDERTRLATELHDSVLQMLTGVALEISAACIERNLIPADIATHLDCASRALKSSRNELRNCLWDLRGQVLDEPDLTTAILRALQPYTVGDPRLKVRFNISRAELGDDIAHAVICIVRELVLNALNRGRASHVQVAGCRDGESVVFTVRDNGCGFDPLHRPSAIDGHFGLQGIHDRVARFRGTFEISSAPGKGTVATVRLPASEDIEP